MTVITLIRLGEDIYVQADRDGAVQADYSMPSALAKFRQDSVSLGDLMDKGEYNYRLYEIPGDFNQASAIIEAALANRKLLRHRSVLWTFCWMYRLRSDIGAAWYEQAVEV